MIYYQFFATQQTALRKLSISMNGKAHRETGQHQDFPAGEKSYRLAE